jgi:hypothetical protein
VSHFNGRFILRYGTEVSMDRPNVGMVPHVLNRDMDVSDAAPWCSDETGICYCAGLLVVVRGDYRVVFDSRQMVDVTECACGGRGVVYERTEWSKGGRGPCSLNCTFRIRS